MSTGPGKEPGMGVKHSIRAQVRESREALLRTLGPGCARCGVKFPDSGVLSDFHIDHPEGRDYECRQRNQKYRIAMYWREYRVGIPLRVLCKSCNGWDGAGRGHRRRTAQ